MLKLLTWPIWLPLYVLTTLDKAAGNRKAGWTAADSDVFFGKPYGKKKFYDPDDPFADDDSEDRRR